jgi:hypothetical protein
MQEQIEVRAGLNGRGAGRGIAGEASRQIATATAEPADAGRPPTQRARLEMVMADPVRRADIHRRVTETAEPLRSIATDHGVSSRRLGEWAREQRWPRKSAVPQGPKRKSMATADGSGSALDEMSIAKEKLVGVLDRQIELVEKRLRRKGAEVEEKDSRILGNLAKALNTMMQMGPGGTTSNHAEPPDRDDLDARLAERIKRWARGEQGY